MLPAQEGCVITRQLAPYTTAAFILILRDIQTPVTGSFCPYNLH